MQRCAQAMQHGTHAAAARPCPHVPHQAADEGLALVRRPPQVLHPVAVAHHGGVGDAAVVHGAQGACAFGSWGCSRGLSTHARLRAQRTAACRRAGVQARGWGGAGGLDGWLRALPAPRPTRSPLPSHCHPPLPCSQPSGTPHSSCAPDTTSTADDEALGAIAVLRGPATAAQALVPRARRGAVVGRSVSIAVWVGVGRRC